MDDKKRKRRSAKPVTPKKKLALNKENSFTLAELRQRYNNLKKEEAVLDGNIQELESCNAEADLQPLMNALHDYNEMKDITQVVLGYLADAEHCSIAELHVRYNLPTD